MSGRVDYSRKKQVDQLRISGEVGGDPEGEKENRDKWDSRCTTTDRTISDIRTEIV